MCGTSRDGLDVAEVIIHEENGRFSFELIATNCYDLTTGLNHKLKEASSLNALDLALLDREVGIFMADCVNHFREYHKLKPTFIASHGITLFHQPGLGMTFQLGHGGVLAAKTGLRVINDFRSQDVALGGQGAPLVPLCDQLLFSEYDFTLNLGGFANISVLGEPTIGFDIGPCNFLLNHICEISELDYDAGGKIAKGGTIDKAFFDCLNSAKYFDRAPPKSMGEEWFNQHHLMLLEQFGHLSLENKLRTAVEHISFQISKTLCHKGVCLVSGGGAHNDFLISRIKSLSKTTIEKPPKNIIDFKEAICFTLLGCLRLQNRNNTESSVTGASKSCSAGAVYLP